MRIQENQLTASKLVEFLQEAIADNGDLPVRFVTIEEEDPEFGDSQPVVGFTTIMNDDDTPDYFLLCEETMTEAFTEAFGSVDYED